MMIIIIIIIIIIGHTMLKKGLCGPPAAGDCSYWNTGTYTNAMKSNPDQVIIMLGTIILFLFLIR